MYIHQAADAIGSLHPIIAKYEDWVVSIVFTFWIYDWIEDRVKKYLAARKAKKEKTPGVPQ